ncbi:hypothetical protein R1sor_025480 [Riccia sorocarpa]|uniref:Late embryogenesis abundant protein LEA-2 subgroup domain-containing protein n=1 Tax=Riccia sorocarpa TaxID=122646 RepID=A0ABD3GBH3_9MARC
MTRTGLRILSFRQLRSPIYISTDASFLERIALALASQISSDRGMGNSKVEPNVEKDLESQEQPINDASTSSSSEAGEDQSPGRSSTDKKEKKENGSKKATEAEAQDFWKKIYNSMKHVESKEQAETLFRGLLSSSKRMDDVDAPAKVEAQGEWHSSQEQLRKDSETRVRQTKSHVPETYVDVDVESNSTPELFPYNAKKVDADDEKLLKSNRQRRRCCFCCPPQIIWCILTSIIPVLAIFLIVYFVLLTPKDPTVTLGDVSIGRFNVNNTGTDGTMVETAMNFTVRLKNPNRYAEVIYDQLDVLLEYKSTGIGSVMVGGVAGYKQQERNSTVIDAQLAQVTKLITDPADAGALQTEAANGNVRVVFTGVSEGHFKLGRLKLHKFDVPVLCVLNIKPESSEVPAELLGASCYNRPS